MLDMMKQDQQTLTQMLQKQQQHQESQPASAAASSNTRLGARDFSKVLKHPLVFSCKTKDEELVRWPAWSWEFEQCLCTLDKEFYKDLKHIQENPKTPLPTAKSFRGRSS